MHGIRRSFIVWWKVPLRRLAGSTERSGRHAWKGLFSYLAKKTDFFFLLRKKIRKVLRIRWHSPPFSVHPFSRNERGRNVLGSLAQLVEQLTLNQFVHGSSPWRGTISFLVRLADGKAGFYLLQNKGIERRIEKILLNLKKVTTSAWGGWRGISCLSLLSHRCLKFPFCRKRFSID